MSTGKSVILEEVYSLDEEFARALKGFEKTNDFPAKLKFRRNLIREFSPRSPEI